MAVRVLFVTLPWKTHLFNFVPLAWALQTAGHEVHVAAEPDLTGAVTGAGLTAVPVGSGETMGERVRRAWREGTLPTPEEAPPPGHPVELYDLGPDRQRLSWQELNRIHDTLVVPRAWLSNDTMFDDLVAYCRSWRPDLVIWNAVTFAGSVAAAAVGAAHARFLFSVDLYSRLRDDQLTVMARQPPQDRRDGLKDWFAPWAAKYGVEFSEELVNGHFSIDQMPASFRLDFPHRTVSMRHVPYNGPAVIPAWLAEPPRAPRVLMTFGVSVRSWPELQVVPVERLRESLDSLADLDVEVVVTLPDDVRASLGRVPANVRVVDFVPLHAVLPTCSAVVHHGGAGSFNGSLLSGVPQLLVSTALDAPFKDHHLRAAGAGLAITPDRFSGPLIRENVVRMLEDPAFRAGAETLRREIMSYPAPNALVPELERLTAEHRA
ncbi:MULTISPECIES: activator-dependent family glycosyltransferase [Actinomadura]|uniref:Activator-dependent family glycosyltransferase n=1 Tax=Actinomadura yumaensis TaxID=111807 RepID=A0ABW2CKI1_9ACTN|nr:activator-dependent family glycosyltransferase [Actinomadura sp. J1-007]QFU19823.1 glycosyltransferase [Actinomadura sp.]